MAQDKKIDPAWAWSEYKPSDDAPWDLKRAGHLFRRASFGANYGELQQATKDGPRATISALLEGGSAAQQKSFETESRYMADSIARNNNQDQLSAWWLHRMLNTQHPLREKLALFWHDHFATSNSKVLNAGYMIGQYDLLYKHAQGNFAELLKDVSYDPAMMVWLDTQDSKKGTPNENYARELMELFSLGLGNYTEADIREAAKAFTGWTLRDGKPNFNPRQHDASEKSVMGKKGNWKPDDIVKICLDQEASAYFIVGKLYEWLVSETNAPSKELLEPLASPFRKSGFDFGALVERVLRSNHFFSAASYRTSVKSPVDFAMAILRGLECRNVQTTALATSLADLGQSVFHPPSVAGWDGGPAWLNAQTLLYRNNLALALTSTEDNRFNNRCDPIRVVAKYERKSEEEIVDFFLDLFLQGDLAKDKRDGIVDYLREANKRPAPAFRSDEDARNGRVRTVCRLVLALPEMQLN